MPIQEAAGEITNSAVDSAKCRCGDFGESAWNRDAHRSKAGYAGRAEFSGEALVRQARARDRAERSRRSTRKESAAKQLQRARLQPIPAGADKSTKPPGTVTRTSPLPGTTVVVNSEAIYWIAEPAPVAVPNVVGLSEKIAVQRLQQTPLRPKLAGADESENPQGTVTRIEPEAGRQIERESEVRYWVAAAKPIVMDPPVSGRTPEEAEWRLRTLPLQPNLGGEESSALPPGTVTRTEPPGEYTGRAGIRGGVLGSLSRIRVPPVIVPDVKGLSSDWRLISSRKNNCSRTRGRGRIGVPTEKRDAH